MKKLMALLCAGVLACSMGMMAFAAESPSTTTTPTVQESSHSTVDSVRVWDKVIVDGKEVDGGVSIVEAPAATVEAAKAQAIAAVSSKASVLQVVEVSFPESFSKITVPFNLTNVVAGQNIKVLHQKKDGTWEVITPDKVENGKVTVTFTSLSPVAFVVADGVAATGVRSPKTGDAAVPFIALIAVVAVAGAAVAGKKAYN